VTANSQDARTAGTGGVRLVVSGGRPTDEELAAVTAVVVALAAQGPATTTVVAHGWTTAARLESVGGAPAESAADPRLPGRGPTRR
jgi:hypothetical protein